ncbi:matrix Gla protein isoform X2 [Austrofundulus limnaeus]|uniref:Matrix Gla protein n=1 Tax=Austrofundulus limnaeus TaxID=52670 RepID=A0A2I4BYU0_AUSLI|nr:PREDICTED: matrix Gla protein isoform X2 [Austrofundulus limnaeus]
MRKYSSGEITETSEPLPPSPFYARQKRSPKMRSLLRFLALCAAVSLCVCYDLFLPRNRAHSFMPPRGNTIYNSPSRNRFNIFMRNRKPLSEVRAETCEDYSPCRLYAFRFGFQQAYQRYFGSRTPSQQVYRPAGIRSY